MEGFSPRNVRRVVAKRVRMNLEEIAEEASSRGETISSSNPEPIQDLDNVALVTGHESDFDSCSSINSGKSNRSSNKCLSLTLGNISNLASSDSSIQDNCRKGEPDLKSNLKTWAIQHNITGLALNDLLVLLKKQKSFEYLPKDHSCSKFNKRPIGAGWYCHICASTNIRNQVRLCCINMEATCNVTLNLDFD
jgi:hypothetical protein